MIYLHKEKAGKEIFYGTRWNNTSDQVHKTGHNIDMIYRHRRYLQS